MVYNATLKRDIPEGWEVKELQSLGTFKNGINYSKNDVGSHLYKIINVRNISSSSFLLHSLDCDNILLNKEQAKNFLVSEQSIIIARSGIPGATRLVTGSTTNTIYCGFIICYEPKNVDLKNLLFFALKAHELSNRHASAGTILKNISQETLKAKKILFPNNSLLRSFNRQANVIFKTVSIRQSENHELAKLRDWLLPMLMNGQVSVETI